MTTLARSLAQSMGYSRGRSPDHVASRPGPLEAARVNAPLFRRLVESLNTERRSVVLDLGPVRSETVALLTPFRCRLEIADLADSLAGLESTEGLEAPPDSALLRERADALLPPRNREPVDIVLCWDLLNYLQRPALTALMDSVAERMRPGALAHALIVYSDIRMPTRPNQYSPHGDGQLAEVATTSDQRNAPRYSPEDLRLCLRSFRSDGATLLKNGMQEFLFRAWS
ncbi:MAG: hypothetical protein R3F24_06470 [Gammaproteobacteria bacterium]